MKKRLEILELIAGLRIPVNAYGHYIESKVGDLVSPDNRVENLQVSEGFSRRLVDAVASLIMSGYYGSIFSSGWLLKRAAIRTMMFRL